MRRRIVLFMLPALPLLCVPSRAVAQTPPSRFVQVYTVENASLPELLAHPGGQEIISAGASALLGTRAGSDDLDRTGIRHASYATLGNGRRTDTAATGDALAKKLAEKGGTIFAFDPIASVLGAQPGITANNCGAGTVECMQWGPGPSVILTSSTDLDLGRLFAGLRSWSDRGGTTILLTPFSTFQRSRHRQHLGAITIIGPRFEPGLLHSDTTRRDGFVTLTDVAPTILDVLGVDIPRSMTGRPLTVVPARNVSRTLLALDTGLVSVALRRSVLLRGLVYFSAILTFFIALLVVDHRRWARARRSANTLLIATCAVPLVMVFDRYVPGTTALQSSAWIIAIALALSVACTRVLGMRRGLAAIAAVTAAAVLIDLALGEPLASRSPISFLLAEGSRFYGIGNELMGVVIGCLLVAFVVLAEEGPPSRVIAALGPLTLTTAVWLMASPSAGAKFGSILTALPAFGLLAARAGGRRTTIRLAAALQAGAVLITSLVYIADRLKPAAQRSHIGSAGALAGTTIARKIAAALRLLALSFWMTGLLAFIAAYGLVAWRQQANVRLMFERRPMLASLVPATGIAIVSAIAFNDAGTIAAALIALYSLALFLVTFSSDGESDRLAS